MSIRVREWPLFYKDILLVKDPDYHVGVCSLWTERHVVEKLLSGRRYNLIGNLYSAQGINAMIRNIFANPAIRTIVLWGAEMSLSGHSLMMLIQEGLDAERRIRNARGEIEREIPDEAVAEFRNSIEVVDLRGREKEVLVSTLRKLEAEEKPAFAKKPRVFPKSEPRISILPSEKVGFRVSSPKIAKTWLRLLNEIYKYGLPKHTRYSKDNAIKEILNLTAVVTDEDPDKIYFPSYLPFSETELKAYYAELLTDRQIPGVAYNYGRRLRRELGVNQIAKMKELIRRRPASKKMAAFTVNVKKDWGAVHKGDTPCLTQILGSIFDNRFYFTAHFRSQDMVHGWPRNAFALRKLQAEIADDTGYKMGPLTIITHSAHIYGDDFKLVETLLVENYQRELGMTEAIHFEFDPRGNVVTEVVLIKRSRGRPKKTFSGESDRRPAWVRNGPSRLAPGYNELSGKKLMKKGFLRATLYEPNGGPPLRVWEGYSAAEIYWQLADWNIIELPSHAFYLGAELQKAEECLRRGKRYKQDRA